MSKFERPSEIANAGLSNIHRIEDLASSLPGIGISTRSGSQSVSTTQIVGIPKILHSLIAIDYSY